MDIFGWSVERKRALSAYLRTFLTPERSALMQRVLAERTRHVTVVVEDIYQPHNASAVLRSCEIFGIQDVHAIENRNAFRPNGEVAMGAEKWVDVHPWNTASSDNTASCLAALREKGYQIAVTALRDDSIPLGDVPLDRPLAFVFGAEERGVTETALSMADMVVRIPMHGFTQSFNISVSVALCLYDLTTRLRASDVPWRLDVSAHADVELAWCLKSLARNEEYIRRFLQDEGAATAGPSGCSLPG